MAADERLTQLLDQWEQAWEAGDDAAAEVLCPEDAGLCEALRLRIDKRKQLYALMYGPVEQRAEVVLPPPLIPGYEILEEIGRGAMGVVYRARQQTLKRLVALKMILAGDHAGATQRARFRAEGEAVARLQHPHIVQIHEVGTCDGRPFLALEFCAGGSLAHALNGTPLPGWAGAQLTEVLARAMHYAHERGIIHRDLKPANILLQGSQPQKSTKSTKEEPGAIEPRESGSTVPLPSPLFASFVPFCGQLTPKISDFGLAKDLDVPGQTASNAVLGTPSYMAPEQAAGATRDATRATDIYALGAILYELLTGRPPFKGATLLETLEQVRSQEPVAPRRLQPRTPRDLETICLKCLAKTPARRYATAAALADDLRAFLEGRPIVARPARWWERAGKWARRHPAGAALLAVVAAAFVLLGMGLRREAWLRQRAEDETTRTKTAEARALAAAHRERVNAARAAADRGQWDRAEKHYARAIADDRADRLALEVERLRGWWTFERRGQLKQELDRLKGRADLGPLAAVVLLHRGDYALSDPSRLGEARDLVRAALRTPRALTPADRVYAVGLLADTGPQAVALFVRALKHDPFHYRANAALVTQLMLLGRFEEARQKTAFMRQVFRHDPLPALVEAWMYLLEGSPEACLKEIERLRPRLGPRRTGDLLAFFRWMRDLLKTSDQINAGELDRFVALGSLLVQLRQGKDRWLGALEPFGFGVPTVTRAFEVFGEMTKGYGQLLFGNEEAAIQTLSRAAAVDPDAIVIYCQALAQMRLGRRHLVRNHRRAGIRAAEQGADLAYRAAEAPTLVPRSPIRYNARWLGVIADAALLLERPALPAGAAGLLGTPPTLGSALTACTLLAESNSGADRRRQARLRANIYRLVAEGRAHPSERAHTVSGLVGVLPPELGLVLLNDWLADQPGNLSALRLRAKIELRGNDPGAALRDAERVLRATPTDREMALIRDAALAGLRTRLKNYPSAAAYPSCR